VGVFGIVGAIGQIAALAGAFGYSRDQERDADRIGAILMREAGYDAAEASKVWANLLAEMNSRPEAERKTDFPLFATHPGVEERMETLARLAAEAPGGATGSEAWQEKTGPYRREWLAQEVKRGRHEESITLLTRLIGDWPAQADYLAARGEVYRLRAQERDLDAAIADFRAAVALGGDIPEAHRGLAYIFRKRNQLDEARASFERYIESAPQAPDIAMIKSYLEELGK
jgi:predicted Zn-dependent protease